MKVLIVEDSSNAMDIFRKALNKSEKPDEAKDFQEARRMLMLKNHWPDMVILDCFFPEDKSSQESPTFLAGRFLNLIDQLIEEREKLIREREDEILSLPNPHIVLVSGVADSAKDLAEVIVWLEKGRIHHAMHKGFVDSTNIDFFIGLLKREIDAIRERIALRTPPEDAYVEMNDVYKIITRDKRMLEVWDRVNIAARTNHIVLVLGESGTGKELIAKSIFGLSKRDDMPYVKVSAPQIMESIEGSALFGYVQGAFTGALKDTEGVLDVAHKGTVFIDEVDKLSLGMQENLLDPTRYGTFTPVGGKKQKKVNVRFIFATNKDLSDLVDKGEFSGELFHRINVIRISLPPLRERKGDIELLAKFFKKMEKSEGITIEGRLMNKMKKMMWKGNIGELKNHIIALVTMRGGKGHITLEDAREEYPKEYAPDTLDVNEDRKDVHSDPIPETYQELCDVLRKLGTDADSWEVWKAITEEHEEAVLTVLKETYLNEKGVTNKKGIARLKDLKRYLDGRGGNDPRAIYCYKALLFILKKPSVKTMKTDLYKNKRIGIAATQIGKAMKILEDKSLIASEETSDGLRYSIKKDPPEDSPNGFATESEV